jgi:hypothetical protein
MYIVSYLPKAGNVSQQRQPLLGNCSVNTPVTRRREGGCHVIPTAHIHAAIEELLEAVFSVLSVPNIYNEDYRGRTGRDRKEGYVLRNLQRGLSAIETWCERWNIRINEDKTQAIYFSHRLRPPEAYLTLNGRNIPFVNYEIISV